MSAKPQLDKIPVTPSLTEELQALKRRWELREKQEHAAMKLGRENGNRTLVRVSTTNATYFSELIRASRTILHELKNTED